MNLFQRDPTEGSMATTYLMSRVGGPVGKGVTLLPMSAKRSKASYKLAGAKGSNTRMVMAFVRGLAGKKV